MKADTEFFKSLLWDFDSENLQKSSFAGIQSYQNFVAFQDEKEGQYFNILIF